MKVCSKSDIGSFRTENQDRVWTEGLLDGAYAIVLCDGMGGEKAGSIASQMTVDLVSERIKGGFRTDISRNSIRNLLITSITAANRIVYDKALAEKDKAGMGTTCVAAIIYRERAYIMNVGDSRAYHIFGDCMQQITKDHTYIRRLIEKGEITEDESKTHPDRNCITRAVGAEAEITPDYFELELTADSILMFCSDGLHAYCEDAKIAEIIVNNPITKGCDLLIDYANECGSRDNVSVAMLQM